MPDPLGTRPARPDNVGDSASESRFSILLIDDDPEVREIVTVALRSGGYGVRACGSGRDALNHLRSHADIRVILLDIVLPIIEAAQFRAAQLRDRSLAWIPVVVISGAADAVRDAARLGARALVTKPVDLDRLKDTLYQVGCVPTRFQGGAAAS